MLPILDARSGHCGVWNQFPLWNSLVSLGVVGLCRRSAANWQAIVRRPLCRLAAAGQPMAAVPTRQWLARRVGAENLTANDSLTSGLLSFGPPANDRGTHVTFCQLLGNQCQLYSASY